jgi:hypothetical protein
VPHPKPTKSETLAPVSEEQWFLVPPLHVEDGVHPGEADEVVFLSIYQLIAQQSKVRGALPFNNTVCQRQAPQAPDTCSTVPSEVCSA